MWFYFRPKDSESNKPIFVESHTQIQASLALNIKGHQYFEFYKPEEHMDLISASAWERGCETNWSLGNFSYREKQGVSNPNNYIDYHSWINNNYLHIVIRNAFEVEVPVKKESKDDGCNCRVCKNWFYMAEPDDLEKDGKLTCFSCKQRARNYKL